MTEQEQWARTLIRSALWEAREELVSDLITHTCTQRDIVLATLILVGWSEIDFTMATLADEYGVLSD